MSLKKIAKLLANKKVRKIAWMLISHPKFIKILKNIIKRKLLKYNMMLYLKKAIEKDQANSNN